MPLSTASAIVRLVRFVISYLELKVVPSMSRAMSRILFFIGDLHFQFRCIHYIIQGDKRGIMMKESKNREQEVRICQDWF